MSDIDIIPLKDCQPTPHPTVYRRLVREVPKGSMISLNNYGVWALEIMFPLANVRAVADAILQPKLRLPTSEILADVSQSWYRLFT